MSSKFTKLLMGGAALALLPATQAFAEGTEAGTAVTNTFTMTYDVGGDPQTLTPDADDTVTFAVDRVVDLTVSVDNAAITANPNDTITQVFTVTNTGNSPQAYDLDFLQQVDGTAPENFDLEEPATFTVTLSIDADGDGTPDSTVSYTVDNGAVVPTPDIGPDGIITVTVVTDVPAGQADGSVATVALEAVTLEPAVRPDSGVVLVGGVPTPGAGAPIGGASGTEVVASTDPNGEATVETVLADGTGTGAPVTGVTDVDNDGDHSAVSVVTVESATIIADKTVDLITQDNSCAFGGATAPLVPPTTNLVYIPGACVQYVIEVENQGNATATNVAVGDSLQGDLSYVDSAVFGPLGGTIGTTTCAANSTTCVVNLTGGELEAGETGQLVILATIK